MCMHMHINMCMHMHMHMCMCMHMFVWEGYTTARNLRLSYCKHISVAYPNRSICICVWLGCG